MNELPEGTVTVLFTDVEGSTELEATAGDASAVGGEEASAVDAGDGAAEFDDGELVEGFHGRSPAGN